MRQIRNGQTGETVRAFAAFYVTGAQEELNTNGNRIQVPWSLSADMLDPENCQYCRRWQITGACPGLRAHAAHAIARVRTQILHHEVHAHVLRVPPGLTRGELTAEVARQLSVTGARKLAS